MGSTSERTPQCLSDDSIAALVDERQFVGRAEAIAHIGTCMSCRHRLAAIVRVTNDASVRLEMDALDAPRLAANSSRVGWRFFTVSGLAAAAVALVMMQPARELISRSRADIRRESGITATDSPRILSPSGSSTKSDALRWTAVSEADVYRVRIWNTNGDVIWSTETRDTVIALPPILQPGSQYLWEVSARTGWNRWTSSDFVEFQIQASPSR